MSNDNPLYIDSTAFQKKLSIELIGLQPVNIGTLEAPVFQSDCGIAIGQYAGQYEQGECAIAIGKQAGETSQATQAIAIGVDAGQLEQNAYALALGLGAGNDNQGTAAIAVGVGAGQFEQDEEAIAIGVSAGQTRQSTCAIAIGSRAGNRLQRPYGIAVGCEAGYTNQGTNSIAIGRYAGMTNQPANSIVLNATGSILSGTTKSSALYVAPIQSGVSSNVLYYDTASKEVLYGVAASGVPDGDQYSDYLFWNSDSSQWNVGSSEVHLGAQAGYLSQGTGAIALGVQAGQNTQGSLAVAIGYQSGNSLQGTGAIAMGVQAGLGNQGESAIAIGTAAGSFTQGYQAIAMGYYAGIESQGSNAIAIGTEAGETNQGEYAIAIGNSAGSSFQNDFALALGVEAGRNGQGTFGMAIGASAGMENQGELSVALGFESGKMYQSSNAIALGYASGYQSQGNLAIAIGTVAGEYGQGTNAIAIGAYAGQTSQPANSIVLNATGAALSGTTKSSALYVAPIQSGTTGDVLYYDSSSNEVLYGAAPSGGGGNGEITNQLLYMDYMDTILYNSTTTGVQVSNTISPSSNIPVFPSQPSVVVPGSFNYTIGSGGSFPDLQTALASPLVTNGMNLQIFAGTYSIPDTTGITINKQVGIWGVGASVVILQTTATLTAPTNCIIINVPNVTLYGVTIRHRKTSNSGAESCINILDNSVSPATGVSNVVITTCRIEFMEFGIVMVGDNFQIRDNIFSYISIANGTRRSIGLYRSTGSSFITNNTILNNTANGNLRFIETTGAGAISANYNGNLVIQNNVQNPQSALQQFFNQNIFTGASNGFSVFLDGNNTMETSAFFVSDISSANDGDLYNKIILTNNSISNIHGKGVYAMDRSAGGSLLAYRSIGAVPVYASKNVVANVAWLSGWAPSPGSFGNVVGYNTTFVSSANVSMTTGNALGIVANQIIYKYLPSGSCTAIIYASTSSPSALLNYSFGYTNTNGYGGASYFQVVQSGTITVNSAVPTAYSVSFSVPLTVLLYNMGRLRFELSHSGTDTIQVYSRTGSTGTLSLSVFNPTPTYVSGTSLVVDSVAANSSTTAIIVFSQAFSSTPVVLCSISNNPGVSVNSDYILISAESVSKFAFTARLRNLNASAAASGFNVNWIATVANM